MRWPKRAPINNVPAGRDNAGEKKSLTMAPLRYKWTSQTPLRGCVMWLLFPWKKVSQLNVLVHTYRKQQEHRISVCQLVICAHPTSWITARACSLPACHLLLHPNWSQVLYFSLTGLTSPLLSYAQQLTVHRTLKAHLGNCLVLI